MATLAAVPEVNAPAEEPLQEGVIPSLSDDAQKALLDLAKSCLKEERSARRREGRWAWVQRRMKNGEGHYWYDEKTGMLMRPEAANLELPQYMDNHDLYGPHHRSFVSLLGEPTLGINFIPKNLQKGVDVTAAAYAEKLRTHVDQTLSMKDRQSEAASYFITDGRTIVWTREDANGELRVTLHGVLESKVPIYARKVENWPYCFLAEEVDLYQAKEDWPEIADEIEGYTDASADSTWERYARLGILAGKSGAEGGDTKNLTTRHVGWIRPSRFKKAADDVQDELKAAFPDGVRITFFGDAVAETVPEKMDTALSVEWPMPGQGSARPSMFRSAVPIQENYNDIKNHIRESADYVDGAMWGDSEALDSEAAPEQRSAPGIAHAIDLKSGKSINDVLYKEAQNPIDPSLIAEAQQLKEDFEFTVGDLPSLYGGDTEGQDTVGVNKLLNTQAKGQLASAWAGLQRLFAKAYEQAIPIVAKQLGDSPFAVTGKAGQEQITPSAILDGQFACTPDLDASFPETTADKRNSLNTVLTLLAPTGLGIETAPDNLKLIKQLSGLKDLFIPGAEARDKQQDEIDQLLQESPIPDETQMPQYVQAAQQSTAQGQQPPEPPMTSSVPIDPVWDYHPDEYAKCQQWLSSPECRQEIRKGNVQGVQNVKLHGAAHKAQIDKLASQNAQPKEPMMSLSANFTDLDPDTKVQALQRDGFQPNAQSYQVDEAQGLQQGAADVQKTAADATHKSVLAARESIPAKKPVSKPNPPNSFGGSM